MGLFFVARIPEMSFTWVAMAKASKTLNPLHFEDLEPHRFEDLVRQLAYDFRNWRSLEPTGRLGADDGYDARGFEITDLQQEQEETQDDEEQDERNNEDRLWQIQCKREKTITPAKLAKYLGEMIPKGADVPYGVIFAAPCDFSKQTRDLFQKILREKGVQEFYLWGKADLEDALLQPKNDHLLYAYFGISLVIRRRSLKTQIRSLLATKRKVVKHLGAIEKEHSFVPILVRDVSDDKYPYMGEVPDFKKRPRWKKYYFTGHTHDGIRVLKRRFIAYRNVDPQSGALKEWDYTDEVNLALDHDDHWNKSKDDDDNFHKAHAFLDKMEENNRGFFEIEGVIPYERIVEIDQLGDTIARCPHIFVEVKNETFFEYALARLVPRGSSGHPYPFGYEYPIGGDDARRIKFFPKKLPKPPKPEPLPPMGIQKKEKNDDKESD